MPIFTPPGNVVTGGTIQASDVANLYTDISGNLDSQNIKTGGLLGTNLAANTVAIGQIKNTSVSTGVSPAVGNHSNALYIVLPSGSYGFFPGISTDANANTQGAFGASVSIDNPAAASFDVTIGGAYGNGALGIRGLSYIKSNTTPQAIVFIAVYNSAVTGTSSVCTLTSFFIQSSPPYDLGDGEIPLFVFAFVNAAGDIVGTWICQDPPWARLRKKKLILPMPVQDALKDPASSKVMQDVLTQHAASIQQLRRLRETVNLAPTREIRASIESQIRDIESMTFDQSPETQIEKNAGMVEIPHPFIMNDQPGHTAVMLDPMSPNIRTLIALHESGEKVTELLHHGYLTLGNTHLKRSGPPGLMVVDHKFTNDKG